MYSLVTNLEKYFRKSLIIYFFSRKLISLFLIGIIFEKEKEIFNVIDHRIEMAPEINGAVNTNYMSMSEHLLIYHVQLFENPISMPRGNKE